MPRFTLENLPDDLLFHFLSYLTPSENCDTALVSKKLYIASIEDVVWKEYFVKNKSLLTDLSILDSLRAAYLFKDIFLQKPYLQSRYASLYRPIRLPNGFWKRNVIMAPAVALSSAYYLFENIKNIYMNPAGYSAVFFLFELSRFLAFYCLFRDLHRNQ